MRSQLEEILQLQPAWTPQNTPEMQRRGLLVRNEVAGWLRSLLPDLSQLVPAQVDDLAVQGKDATGLKSEVPWVRVFSVSRSQRATDGFYIVYLFSGSGSRVYLSLNQGTTQWRDGEFRPLSVDDLTRRVRWAREAIAQRLATRSDLHQVIDLEATKPLGRGYQIGNIVALQYQAGSVPAEDDLKDDLDFMVGALGALYASAENSLAMPGGVAPEVLDVEMLVEEATRPRLQTRSSRKLLRLSASERKAIELRAVQVSTEYLKKQDWKIRDVGATQSYDLDARRGEERLFVEVKGTTSDGAEVILTKNEVDLNTQQHPATMLLVVTGINLDRESNPPLGRGGKLREIYPWKIEEQELQSIAFRYTVPEAGR